MIYFSTSLFESKCGIPVFLSAEPTDEKIMCFKPVSFAASTKVFPCVTSAAAFGCGIVIRKAVSTSVRAGMREDLSVRLAFWKEMLAFLEDIFWEAAVGSRTIARIWREEMEEEDWRALRREPPCWPVTPVMRIVLVMIISLARWHR